MWRSASPCTNVLSPTYSETIGLKGKLDQLTIFPPPLVPQYMGRTKRVKEDLLRVTNDMSKTTYTCTKKIYDFVKIFGFHSPCLDIYNVRNVWMYVNLPLEGCGVSMYGHIHEFIRDSISL
jgi:hypothetical protein